MVSIDLNEINKKVEKVEKEEIKENKASDIEEEDDEKNEWKNRLLRYLIHGDLNGVQIELKANVEAITNRLTNEMDTWMIQWETIHWWKIQNATPLFISSLFAYPNIVRYLLEYGAERDTICYIGQKALDLVGDCSTNEKNIEECRLLLKQIPKLPEIPILFEITLKPTNSIIYKKKIHSIQVNNNNNNLETMEMEDEMIPEEIKMCISIISWETTLSNGSMIKKYEIKYTLLYEKQKSKDNETNRSIQGAYNSKKSKNWIYITKNHSRKKFKQMISLTNLLPGEKYQFMIKVTNGVGTTEWGEPNEFET